LPSLYNPV